MKVTVNEAVLKNILCRYVYEVSCPGCAAYDICNQKIPQVRVCYEKLMQVLEDDEFSF